MNKRSVIVLLSFVAFLFACGGAEKEAENNGTDTLDKKNTSRKLDIYEGSELALLMRQMDGDMRKIKEHLETSGSSGMSFPEFRYGGIHTATPTDPDVRDEGFTPMADALLHNLGMLKSSDTAVMKHNYNLVITSCINCHREYCPGPVQRISKLKVNE